MYYANDRKDAARIGFADNFIYDELMIDPDKRNKQFSVLLPEEGRRAFDMWMEKRDKTEY